MNLFNAVVAIAAAVPSTTSAVQIGAPTNYEERKLQDEVGSIPSIEAIPMPEPPDDYFGKINDFKCELAGGLLTEKLDVLCGFAESTLPNCPRRRLDDHGAHWGSDDLCDELCSETVPFFFQFCCTGKGCDRRLGGEIETVPQHRHLELADSLGGDLAGVVASKDDILPASAADKLRAHIEGLYDAEGFPPVASLPGKGNYEKQVYTHDLDGYELIDLIGKDNAKHLLDFFQDAVGAKVPVTNIQLQLGKHMDEGQYFDWHIDELATVQVWLNDNDDTFQGGDNHYITDEGNIVVPVKKGRAVAHGPHTVHGASLWRGDRVLLSMDGSGSVFDKCMLEDVLEGRKLHKVGPSKLHKVGRKLQGSKRG